jgi:hypothetical protein
LQGASATEALLRETNRKDVRVLVLWEPVTIFDLVSSGPSTQSLARISDARATQYWDGTRALSRLLGERSRTTVVYDRIWVYAPGALWQDLPPKPAYAATQPVIFVMNEARDAFRKLLAANANVAVSGR